jgi:DUF1365 family protein
MTIKATHDLKNSTVGTARSSTGALSSCLYFGQVMHKRLRPFTHRFDYRVFSMLVDLDELPRLNAGPLFGVERWGLFSFHSRDHGPRDGSPLRPWIEQHLRGAGIELDGGAIRVLCFPRVLGYVFNPLSIWFCHHSDGRLLALLYEVRNTFGDLHCYLIPVTLRQQSGAAPITQACDKGFYVSPFIGMHARYRFRLRLPDEWLSILIRQSVPEGELLIATQTGKRRPFTRGQLLRAFVGYPLMSVKVMGAIHWQALKLWRKGATFHRRPKPPLDDVTVVRTTTATPIRHDREERAA